MTFSELSRRIGQIPQNFSKKLERGTVTSEEMDIQASGEQE